MERRNKTVFMTQFAILLAIEAIVCFTPLGSLPAIGPIVATLSHIPVIVTAILLGTKAGAAMGFSFGLFSFIVWTFMPPPLSAPFAFVFTPFYTLGTFQGNFWSLVICFVPRILIGVVAGVAYKAFSKRFSSQVLSSGLSAILGSLTTTFLVLGGIYLFFGQNYALAGNVSYDLLLGVIGSIILTSGLPEAAVAAIVACAVCPPLRRILKRA